MILPATNNTFCSQSNFRNRRTSLLVTRINDRLADTPSLSHALDSLETEKVRLDMRFLLAMR